VSNKSHISFYCKIDWPFTLGFQFQLLNRGSGYECTYLLTPWSEVLLEKLTGSAASQEIPSIFGTRRFITVLTSARYLSLSWANSIQSPQHPPTSWRSILSEPVLYRLLTLHVPKTMSLFRCLLRGTSSRNTPSRRSEWGMNVQYPQMYSRLIGAPRPTTYEEIKVSTMHGIRHWKVKI